MKGISAYVSEHVSLSTNITSERKIMFTAQLSMCSIVFYVYIFSTLYIYIYIYIYENVEH